VVADAYRHAVENLSADDLSQHYTHGPQWLRGTFRTELIDRLRHLTGGEWDLDDWEIFAAGSDVDLITHIIEGVAAHGPVKLYPSDWYGFLVGGTHDNAITFATHGAGDLACLCVPSVRNGHLTTAMVEFLSEAQAQLLNINLFPSLTAEERKVTARALRPILPSALLSVSFSRGFGLTASQLGVLLAPPDHPWSQRYRRQWDWFSYFYNAIAARAFLAIDLDAMAAVDDQRRDWATQWLGERGLPDVTTGSYYVRSFRVEGEPTPHLRPLIRDGVLRCCLKPDPT
jgi:hypothetical protein